MRTYFSVATLAALALTAVMTNTAEAQDAAGPGKTVTLPDGTELTVGPSVEGISEFGLPNGLKILLFPDNSAPKVTVNLTVFVGSRHEGYGEAGMAHLLEHMLFKGTPTNPQPPKVLQTLGAQFNGTTWLDRTNYYETLPASPENLEKAIALEADRFVNSNVLREDLDTEMTVVRNEFERGENSPSRVLGERMFSSAFLWHNYGKSTIGNRADIERVGIPNLRAFYEKYYRPENAMLVVAGSFDPATALQVAAKHFGPIENPDTPLPNTYTEEPPQDGERRTVLRRVGEVGLAGVMYHIPAGPHPDYVPMDVLERVLTAPNTGPLWKALVETKRCASVSGGAYALHDPGIIRFMAQCAPGNDPRDVLGTLVEVVETCPELIETEEGAKLVEQAKTYWLKNWEKSFLNSQGIATQLSEWAAQGDWRLMFLYRDRLEACTPEQVAAAARSYLEESNRTVGLFIPTEESNRTEIPQAEDLATTFAGYTGREAVAAGEAFDVSPANIGARTEDAEIAGLKVRLLPKKTRGGSVVVQINLRYGDADSLAGRNAAMDVLPLLMTRGTKDLSRQDIQDLLDKNRATLSASGEAGRATFTVQTRREFLPQVMDLVKKVLREPSLPEDELSIVTTQQQTALEQQLVDPQGLGITRLRRILGPYDAADVRYTPTLQEEIDRWKALTPDEVRTLYADYFSAQAGEVSAVGDFDSDEMKGWLADLFDGWTSANSYEYIAKNGDVDVPAGVQTIETPDKANAVYFAGTVFPMSDAHPDYPAFMIGNRILGSSGLSSRLGDRVRQKEGLSYGVGSQLNASVKDDRAALLIYAITNPENMAKVETAINEEIALLIENGVTAEELEAAKDAYLEKQKVSRGSDSTLASLLTSTAFAGRDMAFVADREAAITALTVDQVNQTLRKWLGAADIAIIESGDFAKVAAEQSGE